MKLLFDQNLSPRLVVKLSDLFPGSAHVQELGLADVPDKSVWDFAHENEYTIVSKDEDYNTLSVFWKWPPKVLWLVMGNCTTDRIETLIRWRVNQILQFDADPSLGTLILH